MEKSNEVSNPETNAPETTQAQTSLPQTPVDGTPEQPLSDPTPTQPITYDEHVKQQEKRRLGSLPYVLVFAGLALITLFFGVFFYFSKTRIKEKAEITGTEFAEFDLRFGESEKDQTKIDFKANSIITEERFDEANKTPIVVIGAFGEPTDAFSINEAFDQIEKIEKRNESKGIVYIIVNKPKKIPTTIDCFSLPDRPCAIMTAMGAWQVAEGFEMYSGKAKFNFKENGVIEGEIDAAHFEDAFIRGSFRVKLNGN